MNHNYVIGELSRNTKVYESLLTGISKEEYLWKPSPGKWCLLEIVCHLYDEEQFDFRTRVKSVLDDPGATLPAIDPVGWVTKKNYIGQDYIDMLNKFLSERKSSVKWLESLNSPEWGNKFKHKEHGDMSAEFFLANWLAHDYLHFRQIIRMKFKYLESVLEAESGMNLLYAGEW